MLILLGKKYKTSRFKEKKNGKDVTTEHRPSKLIRCSFQNFKIKLLEMKTTISKMINSIRSDQIRHSVVSDSL